MPEVWRVYRDYAVAEISNVATNFTAYQFFNDKQGIATDMLLALNAVYSRDLFARVLSFQITRVDLPTDFQHAIFDSIAAKQNITTSRRYAENMEVTFATSLLVANATKQQKIAAAQGLADTRAEQAAANSAIVEQTVTAEMYSYGNFSKKVGLNTSDGLSYMCTTPPGLEPPLRLPC